jgi:hypothetical protein
MFVHGPAKVPLVWPVTSPAGGPLKAQQPQPAHAATALPKLRNADPLIAAKIGHLSVDAGLPDADMPIMAAAWRRAKQVAERQIWPPTDDNLGRAQQAQAARRAVICQHIRLVDRLAVLDNGPTRAGRPYFYAATPTGRTSGSAANRSAAVGGGSACDGRTRQAEISRRCRMAG